MTLLTLPYPPLLAFPLINNTAQVTIGDTVTAGQVLAYGNLLGVDTICSVNGTVIGIETMTIASDEAVAARCIVIKTANDTPTIEQKKSFNINDTTVVNVLKRAGIVGLGGGAFPAWRKWRQNLKAVIINGLQTDPRISADQALLESVYQAKVKSGADLMTVFQTIANAFNAPITVALRDDFQPQWQHPMIQRIQARYADGNERLLIKKLLGISIDDSQATADVGVVTFNIATALAIVAALSKHQALSHRIVTVVSSPQKTHNIVLPLGALVSDVQQFLGLCPTQTKWFVGDASDVITNDAVIHAQTTILSATPFDFYNVDANACIRCGHCTSVCPSQLAPWNLYHLAQNNQSASLEKSRLNDCLLCRRCDEVCPSHIPLTSTFKAQKRILKQTEAQQTQQQQWQTRFDEHSARLLQKKNKNWAKRDALKSLLQNS